MANADSAANSVTDHRGQMLLVAISLGILATAFGFATDLFLILFLAILFAVFLSHSSRLLARSLKFNYLVCLAIITVALVAVLTGGVIAFGVQLEQQISKARQHLDEGTSKLKQVAQEYSTVDSILRSTPFLREIVEEGNSSGEQDAKEKDDQQSSSNQLEIAQTGALRSTAKKGAMAIAGVFKSTFGLLVNSLLIFFVGLFLAISPRQYRDGCVKLVAPRKRQRIREVLDLMGNTLWDWLVGRLGTMLITGTGAGLLLAILGVPMAATLGVMTALLSFVPNIGSFISLLLAVLFALPQGGTIVLAVAIGYIVLQLIESYVVTPLIQQRQAELPPALLISFQAILGVLFGFLGTAVASPLLAVVKVGVEELYVKDYLETTN